MQMKHQFRLKKKPKPKQKVIELNPKQQGFVFKTFLDSLHLLGTAASQG